MHRILNIVPLSSSTSLHSQHLQHNYDQHTQTHTRHHQGQQQQHQHNYKRHLPLERDDCLSKFLNHVNSTTLQPHHLECRILLSLLWLWLYDYHDYDLMIMIMIIIMIQWLSWLWLWFNDYHDHDYDYDLMIMITIVIKNIMLYVSSSLTRAKCKTRKKPFRSLHCGSPPEFNC